MQPLQPMTLAGEVVRLEPHAEHHRPALQQAADDPDLWRYALRPGFGEHFEGWWQEQQQGLHAGAAIPWVVILQSTGQLIGSTSFLNISLRDQRLEIGSTWYQKKYHGTAVNPACKGLLLQLAFETLGFYRVEFCVDALNHHSRRAVTKLGATQEGMLRSHRITQTGRRRDTVLFSLLRSEWPAVQQRLFNRLQLQPI
ncbi:MAG TPA: GNAT family protein [Gemmatales bacterium]|nr:GNAT family protein [Gemmatales bacterium]HMP16376.1 GNAT family protein [Gemmatales bacterium]